MRHLFRFVHFISILALLFLFSSCEDKGSKLMLLPLGGSSAPAAGASINWLGSMEIAPEDLKATSKLYDRDFEHGFRK